MRWVIAGVPIEGQRELLARFRDGDAEERAVGARGAARALRGALPRRAGALSGAGPQPRLREQFQALALGARGRTNRAVAGLSTNSSTLAASRRAPPGAGRSLVHRDHRRRARSRRRNGRCAPRRRRGASDGTGSARTDARRPPRVSGPARCPIPSRHAPHQDRRHHRPRLARARDAACAWSRPAWTSRG